MTVGDNAEPRYSYGAVEGDTNTRFQQTVGVSSPDVGTCSLVELRSLVDDETDEAFVEMGRSLRDDLEKPLDGSSIESELADLAAQFERLPALREMGTPEYGETPYQELVAPARELVEHLDDVGFFHSAETHLPGFSEDDIERTTRQLLTVESLPETISSLGLSEDEQLALVANIVNASGRLSWWEPTREYPSAYETDEFDEGVVHEYVPPLHQRAMEGSVLWIEGLDWWLWQNSVLISDEIVERCVWDVKTMLTGAYLLGDAALGLARETIEDDDLTTVTTASTAMMILGQEYLADDVARITDEERKPRAHAEE